jgi:hypothetical protein
MAGLDARAALAEVVPEAREVVGRLLAERPVPPAELRRQLEALRAAAAAVAAKDEYLDVALVDDLVAGCLALLDHVAADAPGTLDHGERQRLVQVACRYLVLDEDGEGDFASLLGFDDDASVFNAAARALGREDLRVVP